MNQPWIHLLPKGPKREQVLSMFVHVAEIQSSTWKLGYARFLNSLPLLGTGVQRLDETSRFLCVLFVLAVQVCCYSRWKLEVNLNHMIVSLCVQRMLQFWVKDLPDAAN